MRAILGDRQRNATRVFRMFDQRMEYPHQPPRTSHIVKKLERRLGLLICCSIGELIVANSVNLCANLLLIAALEPVLPIHSIGLDVFLARVDRRTQGTSYLTTFGCTGWTRRLG